MDLSGYSTNQLIDLRQGAFSNAGALTANISIAMGTHIQNARGGSGNDTFFGNSDNDTFIGGPGNDTITGGTGTNTSVYSGASKNYVATLTAGSATATVQDKVGTDGTDTLTSIQNAQFTDQTILLSQALQADAVFSSVSQAAASYSLTAQGSALPASPMASLTSLYIADLARAPDALGLDYWATQLSNGMSLPQIAASFLVQPETAGTLGGQTNQAFINTVYQNLFGRPADTVGLNYWLSQLQSGGATNATLVLNIVSGAQGVDAQYVVNKEAVGDHFAVAQGLTDGNWAKTVMVGVNGTTASVTSANHLTDGFAATAATANGSELVVQILGIVA